MQRLLAKIIDFKKVFFFYLGNKTPGPGDYDNKNDLNGNGKYPLSSNKGNGTRLFPKNKKKCFT